MVYSRRQNLVGSLSVSGDEGGKGGGGEGEKGGEGGGGGTEEEGEEEGGGEEQEEERGKVETLVQLVLETGVLSGRRFLC